MDTQSIITELEAERDRLSTAIEALQGGLGWRGRSAGKIPNEGKRRLSDAARKRISEAMKAQWAKRKKAVA